MCLDFSTNLCKTFLVLRWIKHDIINKRCKVSVTLCKVSVTLCKISVTLCKIPVTLCKTPVTLCKISVTLCKISVTLCKISVTLCKVSVTLVRFSEISIFSTHFQKITKHSCKCVRLEPSCSIRTDRHKANSRLLQFCEHT